MKKPRMEDYPDELEDLEVLVDLGEDGHVPLIQGYLPGPLL